MNKRLVVAGYIDGPWQCIEVDPDFGNVELWDHDMADFIGFEPEEGELQRTIDEAEMTAELEDWLEDIDFIRHGGS